MTRVLDGHHDGRARRTLNERPLEVQVVLGVIAIEVPVTVAVPWLFTLPLSFTGGAPFAGTEAPPGSPKPRRPSTAIAATLITTNTQRMLPLPSPSDPVLRPRPSRGLPRRPSSPRCRRRPLAANPKLS